ncbi:hypothetical protein CPLU01_05903 [Colletotrichum plurivorum]|uniref:Uncharacterized protein n=1 Tax=Colletotrichum plurivorum TaxID=2175906 RepID=A0A8H6KJT2_9PEZI|nr:hypothetical protein CPLU01_05903 [Colletotrichum plurivorum]
MRGFLSFEEELTNLIIGEILCIVIFRPLGRFCKSLILPCKPVFLLCLRLTEAVLGLPDTLRITTDFEEGIYDNFCVASIIFLAFIGLLLILTLATPLSMRGTIRNFYLALMCLSCWLVCGMFARCSLEMDHGHEPTLRPLLREYEETYILKDHSR